MSIPLVTTSATAYNPADGTTVIRDDEADIVDFIAGAAITATEWVSFDYANVTGAKEIKQVIQSAVVSTGNTAAIGVALDSATAAGQTIRVQVGGRCASAKHTASAGNVLIVAGTTAGIAEAAAATDICRIVGFATEDNASGVGPVVLYRY
jgi:hypothetical protein